MAFDDSNSTTYKFYAISPPNSLHGNNKLYLFNKMKLFCIGKGLHDSTMHQVAVGARTHHHGWRCGYLRSYPGIFQGIRIKRGNSWWNFRSESEIEHNFNIKESRVRDSLNGLNDDIECERIYLQYKLEHKDGQVYYPDNLVEFINMANKICSETYDPHDEKKNSPPELTLNKIQSACTEKTNEVQYRFIKNSDWKVSLVPTTLKYISMASSYTSQVLASDKSEIELHSLLVQNIANQTRKRPRSETEAIGDIVDKFNIREIAQHDTLQDEYVNG